MENENEKQEIPIFAVSGPAAEEVVEAAIASARKVRRAQEAVDAVIASVGKADGEGDRRERDGAKSSRHSKGVRGVDRRRKRARSASRKASRGVPSSVAGASKKGSTMKSATQKKTVPAKKRYAKKKGPTKMATTQMEATKNGHLAKNLPSTLPVPPGTKDPVAKLLSQAKRTLNEAITTWKNNPGVDDASTIVESQLRMMSRNLAMAADEVASRRKGKKSGSGR